MHESNKPAGGLQDPGSTQLQKGLESEEERKKREQLQKGLGDKTKPPPSGLTDPVGAWPA